MHTDKFPIVIFLNFILDYRKEPIETNQIVVRVKYIVANLPVKKYSVVRADAISTGVVTSNFTSSIISPFLTDFTFSTILFLALHFITYIPPLQTYGTIIRGLSLQPHSYINFDCICNEGRSLFFRHCLFFSFSNKSLFRVACLFISILSR